MVRPPWLCATISTCNAVSISSTLRNACPAYFRGYLYNAKESNSRIVILPFGSGCLCGITQLYGALKK